MFGAQPDRLLHRRLAAGHLLVDATVEGAAEDRPQRERPVTLGDVRAVGRDEVDRGDRRHQGAVELPGVERPDELAPEVLGPTERTQQVRAEQRRVGRVGAEEARGRRRQLAVDDGVVHGDVVTAEAPPPRGAGVRIAEHADVVHPGVATAGPAEGRPPVLDGVEHVLQPDDRGGGDVRRLREAGAQEAQRRLLLAGVHRPERQAAVIGRCVEPQPALLVGRERPCRQFPLPVVEPVDPRPCGIGHPRRHGAAVIPRCHGTTMPSPSTRFAHGRADAGPDLQVGSGTVPGSGPRPLPRAIPAAWAMEADRGQAAVNDGDPPAVGQPGMRAQRGQGAGLQGAGVHSSCFGP